MSQPETAASSSSPANAAQAVSPAPSTAASAKALPSASAADAKYGFRARFARFQQSRPYRGYSWLVKYRRRILVSASVLYLGTTYASAYVAARKRDKIHDSTYLYWKVSVDSKLLCLRDTDVSRRSMMAALSKRNHRRQRWETCCSVPLVGHHKLFSYRRADGSVFRR